MSRANLSHMNRLFGIALAALAVLSVGCDPDEDPEPPMGGVEITEVVPAQGPAYGGNRVTLKGKGFVQGMKVFLADTAECTQVVWVSEAEMNCVTSPVPAGLALPAMVDVRAATIDAKKSAILELGYEYRCQPDSPIAGLHVWANDGTDKVPQEEMRANCDPYSLKNSIWDGTGVSLFAGRNESVQFNMILEAPTAAIANVTVEFDTLNGEGSAAGESIHSVAADGDEVFNTVGRPIENFYVRYLEIKGLSLLSYEDYDERHIPYKFRLHWTGDGFADGYPYRHDDGSTDPDTRQWSLRPHANKHYPDIAVPIEAQGPFDIARGNSQSVWTDIYVAKGQKPGTYRGNWIVKSNGTVLRTIEVVLKVRNYTLGDTNFGVGNQGAAKTMVSLGYADIGTRYVNKAYPDNNSPEDVIVKRVRDRHVQMAHRHRLSIIDTNEGAEVWTDQDRPRPHWQRWLSGELFTAANGYSGPGESIGNNIFVLGTYDRWRSWSGANSAAGLQAHLDNWETWFQANASGAERLFFVKDEPRVSDGTVAQTETWTSWVTSNPGVGQAIKPFVTYNLVKSLTDIPSLGVVGDLLAVADTAAYDSALSATRARGDKLILYNGKRPGSGSFATEDEGTSLREIAWGQYKKKVDRWYYWDSTHYVNALATPAVSTNVFQVAQTFGKIEPAEVIKNPGRGVTGASYSNGNGVLFYPGTDALYPQDSYGLEGPIASLRMKHWRRGIQDVEYILLAKARNAARTQAIVDAMVPHVLWENGVDALSPTTKRVNIGWSTVSDDWEVARCKLAEVIEGIAESSSTCTPAAMAARSAKSSVRKRR